ncbi:DUF4190 domain-containing protein [Streptomyces sp. NPDC001130]
MSDHVPQSTPQENRPAGTSPTAPPVSLDKGAGEQPGAVQDAIPGSRPDAGTRADSVHYQQTLTSLPATPAEPADAVRPSWAPPTAHATPPAANPFAPPPAMPPAATPPANPYAPPATQHAGPEPVPPPPIAPTGPGQVPYGYPGTASAYGYPGLQQLPPYGTPYPSANGYGWPGMPPMPSNGMGTASLVLGILSAVLFVLWPLALIMGVLAIIFGILGRAKAKRGEATNPGMALAGLICGGAGIAIVAGFIGIIIAVNT